MNILVVMCEDGTGIPLCWSNKPISRKVGRWHYRTYKNDKGVTGFCNTHWSRFYDSKQEAKRDLQRIG